MKGHYWTKSEKHPTFTGFDGVVVVTPIDEEHRPSRLVDDVDAEDGRRPHCSKCFRALDSSCVVYEDAQTEALICNPCVVRMRLAGTAVIAERVGLRLNLTPSEVVKLSSIAGSLRWTVSRFGSTGLVFERQGFNSWLAEEYEPALELLADPEAWIRFGGQRKIKPQEVGVVAIIVCAALEAPGQPEAVEVGEAKIYDAAGVRYHGGDQIVVRDRAGTVAGIWPEFIVVKWEDGDSFLEVVDGHDAEHFGRIIIEA